MYRLKTLSRPPSPWQQEARKSARGTMDEQGLCSDTTRQPRNPVHPGRARLLLASGKAAVFSRYPFTIILKRVVEHPEVHPLRLKIDPGSQTTGMALVHDPSGEVVWVAELTHRGEQIKQ